MRSPTKLRAALGTLAGLLLCSPTLLSGEQVHFFHHPHLAEKLACADCHDPATGAPRPDRAKCKRCHEPPGPPQWDAGQGARMLRLTYDHKRHVDKRKDSKCEDCHAKSIDDRQPRDRLLIEPAECFACHAKEGSKALEPACDTCHGPDRKNTRPYSHTKTWELEHGEVMTSGPPKGHGRICAECHPEKGKNACVTCHQVKKPLSHKRHLSMRKAKCADCHGAVGPNGHPTLLIEGCRRCHEGKLRTPEVRSPAARLLRGVRFSHELHSEKKKIECKFCHEPTLRDEHSQYDPLLVEPTCEACHFKRDVPVAHGDCDRCHLRNRKERRPLDHDAAWSVRHGQEAAWRTDDQHGKTCRTCHDSQACIACHQTERPRSHNGLWRVRTHGQEAAWDRDSCKTCHETGSCDACHRQTAPLNHRGSWEKVHGLAAESRTNERCTVCHNQAWCAACHAGQKR